MDNYKQKLKKIDDKLLAIERHLVSDIALDRSFENYLVSLRSSLSVQRDMMMREYNLIANAPKGDIDSPESIESEESSECLGDSEKDSVTLFSEKAPAVHHKTRSMVRYSEMPHKIMMLNYTVAPEEMRPSIGLMSTQTEFNLNSDSEFQETSPFLIQSPSCLRKTDRSSVVLSEEDLFHTVDLISSIGGVNHRNVRSVIRSFSTEYKLV